MTERTQQAARAADRTGQRPAPTTAARPPAEPDRQPWGNQAALRALRSRGVQAKPEVSTPGDEYEREADRLADAALRAPLASPVNARPLRPSGGEIQRQSLGEKKDEDEKKKLQAREAPGQTPEVTPAVEAGLSSLGNGGRPLAPDTRSYFESRFGRDLGGVRVHDDARAASTADALNAQAFTRGQHIAFNQGRYDPGTPQGDRLLAHELVHTFQQAPSRETRPGPTTPSPDRVARQAEAPPAPAQPQPAPAASPDGTAAAAPTEEVSLATPGPFAPPQPVADYLEQQGRAGGDVRVRLGNIAAGSIRVRKDGENYRTLGPGGYQTVALSHPALEPLRGSGAQPVLAVRIAEGAVTGYVSVAAEVKAAPSRQAVTQWIEAHPDLMGWVGLSDLRFPRPVNTFENGTLTLRVPDFRFKLGGFLDGTANFGLANEVVTFHASAGIKLKGLAESQLEIDRDETGALSGRVEIPVQLASFTGNVTAVFGNGTVEIRGTARYETEKLSGEVTLLVADSATARQIALMALGPEALVAAGEGDGGGGDQAPARGPKPGPRALAGWGTLNFRFTEWLTGRAMVIVDNEGHVTVVGEIAPPAEVELFPQKDFIKPIFKVEVRASYGIPVVGNIFVFANIGLDAMAKLGPGKIYNIRVAGTYSTDPNVLNNFTIEATLNISAFAGLRLRAEGGAGIEILDHDIKVGVGLNALAGVRGYVEATPSIGYREKATPEAGKEGEFFIHGHMELAAQPFLGLSGDLFVQLDSPWWSPAPDKTWTWPIGELEYPLPGEFGLGADVDYVIGSDQLPDIQFTDVAFSADKFMTDLVDDHVPSGSHGDQEKPGQWQEGGGAGASAGAGPGTGGPAGDGPQAAPAGGAGAAGGGGAGAGGPAAAPGRQTADEAAAVPTPAVAQRWGAGMKALGDLAQQSQRDALTQAEVDTALASLRQQYGFSVLRARPEAETWVIHAEMNPKGDVRAKREETPGDEPPNPDGGGILPPGATKTQANRLARILRQARDAGATVDVARLRLEFARRTDINAALDELEAELRRSARRAAEIMGETGQTGREPGPAEGTDRETDLPAAVGAVGRPGLSPPPPGSGPIRPLGDGRDMERVQAGWTLDLTGYMNSSAGTLNIDPDYHPPQDRRGRSNRERAAAGRAPVLPGGQIVELHHTTQSFFSPLQEISSGYHRSVNDDPDFHPLTGDPGYLSWRGLPAAFNGNTRTLGYIYNLIRARYWRNRGL
ncbi:MAG: DUF4157 domain-containing protein [Isosphaeraceae bacterium]